MEINSEAVSRQVKAPAADTQTVREPATDAMRGSDTQPAAQSQTNAGTPAQSSAPAAQSRESAVVDMLMGSGFKASPENIKLAMALLEAQIPLNAENLRKLNQSMRLMGLEIGTGAQAAPTQVEDAMFFLKNDIPPTLRNAEILQDYINGGTKIMVQLESLMQAIDELPDEGLREDVLRALAQEPAEEPAVGGLTKGLRQNAPSETGASPTTPSGTGIPTPPAAGAPVAPGTAPPTQAAPTAAGAATPTQTAPTAMPAQTAPPTPGTPTSSLSEQGLSALAPTVPPEADKSAPSPLSAASKAPAAPETFAARELARFSQEMPQDEPARTARRSPVAKEDLLSLVKRRLRFDPKDTTNKDVDEFLNRLRNGLEAARAQLSSKGAGTERLQRELANIKDNLEFVNHIKENIYLQLPISIQNHETNGEILVFQDRKARKRGDGVVSALIALDTRSLGRFEVYVQKENRNIHCQFRLRDEGIERLTQAHVSELRDLLKGKGYDLSSVTYKKAEESFTLLSREQTLGDSAGKRGRQVFDMRL